MYAPAPAGERLTSLILWVTAAWFVAAVLAGGAGVFATTGPPIALGLAVAGPPLLAIALLVWSPRFQQWTRSLDLRLLITLHMWRLGGYGFLAIWAVGELPGSFALPAGYGDILVGLTAPLVAFAYLGRAQLGKAVFDGWSALGILDLIAAVTLGILHSSTPIGILAGSGPDTDVMSVLPMSVIPTFGVPLMLSLHAMAIYLARHRDWTAQHATSRNA